MSLKIISKPLIFAAAATVATVGLGGYVWHEDHRPPILEIYFFTLKSGRSIFIRTPEDKRILIDGGADASVIRELTGILPFYSRRIDTIVSTGTDGKNVSGLIDVMDRFNIERAFIPAVTDVSLGFASTSDGIYFAFLDSLYLKKIAVHELKAGDRIDLDGKVSAEVLFPVPTEIFAYLKASSPELALRISYASTSAALLGAASRKVQKYIASTSASGVNLLAVSQSADPADMPAELINALQPEFLIYSKSLVKPQVLLSGKKAAKSAAISKKTSVKPASKDERSTDPLALIPDANRLNLKETGMVRMVSDGVEFEVSR